MWFGLIRPSGLDAPLGQSETLELVPYKRPTLVSYAMCASNSHHLKQGDSHSPTGPLLSQ